MAAAGNCEHIADSRFHDSNRDDTSSVASSRPIEHRPTRVRVNHADFRVPIDSLCKTINQLTPNQFAHVQFKVSA